MPHDEQEVEVGPLEDSQAAAAAATAAAPDGAAKVLEVTLCGVMQMAAKQAVRECWRRFCFVPLAKAAQNQLAPADIRKLCRLCAGAVKPVLHQGSIDGKPVEM